MTANKLPQKDVVKWLGNSRFKRLGEGRQAALKQASDTAPDVPTAALWTLQKCNVMPTEADLTRWSADVAAVTPAE